MDLLSVSTAVNMILSQFSVVGSESIPLHLSRGRILAEDVRAPIPLPMFTNSSMDGFAVISDDLIGASKERPVSLSVIADLPAGTGELPLMKSGRAMRIMTGAPIPPGCDAVVPVEDTNIKSWRPEAKIAPTILIFRQINPGENLRRQGEDVKPGEMVLKKGAALRSQEVGFLSMFGVSEIQVYRKPRVALLSTGDELMPVGSSITPGHIYDANFFTLASLVEEYGGEVINLGIAPDQKEPIKNRLDMAGNLQVDLIVSSAGVSVGAFDFVRNVVEENGYLAFWRVNIRPGKPLAFGNYRGIPFLGLPGNPVSAFVGFEVFVLPAIQKLKGIKDWSRPVQTVRLSESIQSDGRESYLRAIVSRRGNEYSARLTGHQGSGNLKSLVDANAFLIVPSEVKSLPIGSEIFAWITGEVRYENNLEK
jgi:molybdopterin molybdotransferase